MNIYQFNLSLGGQTSAKEMQAVLDRSAPMNDGTPAAVLEDRAAALNNLGVISVQQKDLKTAEPLFAEAAALYERLPGKGSEGMAIGLANAGALYDDMQFYAKAEKAYMGAREIYERLALGDLEKHNPYFSKLLTRLGNIYAAEGKYRLAETALLEGIGILEILVKDDPEGCRQDMIDVLTGLAALYTAMRDWEEAERRLQRALTLSEGMGVALLHKRLGDLYSRRGDAGAGKEQYKRTLELYKDYSDVAEGPLAQTLIGYASLCYETKDYSTAKTLFLRAKELCESLIPTNRDAAESDLAAILHYLGGVYRKENNAEAESAVLTRMSQLSVLHAKFNPIQGPLRADVLLNLASGYAMKRGFVEAKEAYLSALEVFDWLENINPGMYQSTQAAVLHSLGSLYRDFGHLREAESAYNRSITVRNKLALAYPSIYEAVLARTYISLAKLYVKMEEKRRSISAYKFAVPLFERLAVEDASMYEPELLHLYHSLAAALLEEKDRPAAREVWEKALPIEERKAETDAGHETSLIYTLLNLANIDSYEKEYRHAELQYKKALLIKLQFRDRQPEKFEHDTAKILRGLGRSYAREENWTEAEETLLQSLQLYDQLEKAQHGLYVAKKEDVLTILEKVYMDSTGEGEPTVAMMEKQVAVYQQLDALHPGTHGPGIAELLTALAGEYADADNTEEALDARLQAHAIFSTLIDNELLEYRPPLAESLLWLAILQEQRNDFDAAEKAYRECLEVYAAMAKDNGPAFHLKQANALMYYGKYLLRQGQADAGKEWIDQAVQLSKAYAGD